MQGLATKPESAGSQLSLVHSCSRACPVSAAVAAVVAADEMRATSGSALCSRRTPLVCRGKWWIVREERVGDVGGVHACAIMRARKPERNSLA